MTSHFNHEANLAPFTVSIAIRRATSADAVALEHLAALDSAPALSGEILIAEVGEQPQAAIEIATGTAIADPFRPTSGLVELLRVRAESLREQGACTRRRRWLRLRREPCRAM